MLRSVFKVLKRIPLDFGQYELRYSTKGKQIAFGMVSAKPGGKALDLGCRDGHWSEKLKAMGYDVTAVDLEPTYADAVQLDIDQGMPFPDDSFDVVWFTEVIEHVREPELAVKECMRVLKPGGRLLLTTPNREFWFFRAMQLVGIDPMSVQNEDHKSFFSYDDITQMAGPHHSFGYFPYMFLRFTIQSGKRVLSPTIVAGIDKA